MYMHTYIFFIIRYAIHQITCIATSPTLADDDIYRRYIQLLPPEFESAQGFYSIISYYGWQRVGVILQEADLFEKVCVFKLPSNMEWCEYW